MTMELCAANNAGAVISSPSVAIIFNVHNEKKRVEVLKDMHKNPVKRGLVQKHEEWPWSSY